MWYKVGTFLSFLKWKIALNSSLYFISKSSDGMPCFSLCYVSAVVISQAKTQFADSVLVYRGSVEINLPLTNCCLNWCPERGALQSW